MAVTSLMDNCKHISQSLVRLIRIKSSVKSNPD